MRYSRNAKGKEVSTMEEESKSNLTAIRTYFESGPRGRKVEMSELKALTQEDREEIGTACKKALGWE